MLPFVAVVTPTRKAKKLVGGIKMKDYRLVFAYAAVLFAVGFILNSIKTADAYSSGPNISYGSNPVFAVSTLSHTGTIYTNNTSSVAIVTDLFVESTHSSGYCRMTFSVSNNGDSFISSSHWYSGGNVIANLASGIKVPPGESITTSVNTGSYCGGAAISGYYAHP